VNRVAYAAAGFSVATLFFLDPARMDSPAKANLENEFPFYGVLEGTGRACYGRLDITPIDISWLTPFSKCKNLPYDFSDLGEHEGRRHFLYRMTNRKKSCLYEVIMLRRNRNASDGGAIWEAIGYRTIHDYESNSIHDSMSCYMIQIK